MSFTKIFLITLMVLSETATVVLLCLDDLSGLWWLLSALILARFGNYVEYKQ